MTDGGGWQPGGPILDWTGCKTRVRVRNVWSTCEAHEWKRRKDVPVGMNHERTRSRRRPVPSWFSKIHEGEEHGKQGQKTQQQLNPSESKERRGFPSRKDQVGRMQQSTRPWWGKVSTREAKMETRTATLDMILTFWPFLMLLPLDYSEMRQTSRKYAE